jgi:hypothetical protein
MVLVTVKQQLVVAIVCFAWTHPLTYDIWSRFYNDTQCQFSSAVSEENTCAIETIRIIESRGFSDTVADLLQPISIYLRDHPQQRQLLFQRDLVSLLLFMLITVCSRPILKGWSISVLMAGVLYIFFTLLTSFPYPGIYRPSQLIAHQIIALFTMIFVWNASEGVPGFSFLTTSIGMSFALLSIATKDILTETAIKALLLAVICTAFNSHMSVKIFRWWGSFADTALCFTIYSLRFHSYFVFRFSSSEKYELPLIDDAFIRDIMKYFEIERKRNASRATRSLITTSGRSLRGSAVSSIDDRGNNGVEEEEEEKKEKKKKAKKHSARVSFDVSERL